MRHCSFCGRDETQVRTLLKSSRVRPGAAAVPVFICDECVAVCTAIIEHDAGAGVDAAHVVMQEWTEVEVDGERFRWSAARTTISHDGAPRRVLLLSVGRLGGAAVGVVYPEQTALTDELVVGAVRRGLEQLFMPDPEPAPPADDS